MSNRHSLITVLILFSTLALKSATAFTSVSTIIVPKLTPIGSPFENVKIHHLSSPTRRLRLLRRYAAHVSGGSSRNSRPKSATPNFLLQEFQTVHGEILNPYQVLNVKRTAELAEIKQAYYRLSRRYHPDSMRHRDVFPGRCNNLEDVRDMWERIKLSYEILRNPKIRKRFDRHEVLADPAAALKRAAMDAAVSSVKGVGKGLWGMGVFAVTQIQKTSQEIQLQKQQQLQQQQQQQQKPKANQNAEVPVSPASDRAQTKTHFQSPLDKIQLAQTLLLPQPRQSSSRYEETTLSSIASTLQSKETSSFKHIMIANVTALA